MLFALPFPAVDPVLISFGPVAIRWYALAYIAGILLGWFYIRALLRNERLWGGAPRHPSQLYEAALEGVVLFVVLRLLTHRGRALQRPGFVTGAFAAGYGVARIVAEFFRMPDIQIGFLWGGLTMGMVLSLPLIVIGIWLMLRPAARIR